MKRGAIGFGLLTVTLMCLLLFSTPIMNNVYAASAIVQQNSTIFGITNVTPSPFTETVAFGANVASGDVIVLGLMYDSAQSVVQSVTDTRGSVYSLVVATNNVAIYDTTLTSSGPDTLSAHLTLACAGHCSGNNALYVFEVSGVQTAGAGTGVGSTSIFTTGTITTNPVNFAAGAFLLGVIFVQCNEGPCTDSAGAGFTLVSVPLTASEAQYAISGVTSPSTFPASHTLPINPSQPDALDEASIALNPIGTPIPPIPEYRLGLPILAILMIVGYGLVRHRVRNDCL